MLQSVGIFAVSVSGHASLPSLRTAMRKPAQFPRVLTLTFSVLLAFYASVAAAG
jgi:vesicular inhibitory amino acid transporter